MDSDEETYRKTKEYVKRMYERQKIRDALPENREYVRLRRLAIVQYLDKHRPRALAGVPNPYINELMGNNEKKTKELNTPSLNIPQRNAGRLYPAQYRRNRQSFNKHFSCSTFKKKRPPNEFRRRFAERAAVIPSYMLYPRLHAALEPDVVYNEENEILENRETDNSDVDTSLQCTNDFVATTSRVNSDTVNLEVKINELKIDCPNEQTINLESSKVVDEESAPMKLYPDLSLVQSTTNELNATYTKVEDTYVEASVVNLNDSARTFCIVNDTWDNVVEESKIEHQSVATNTSLPNDNTTETISSGDRLKNSKTPDVIKDTRRTKDSSKRTFKSDHGNTSFNRICICANDKVPTNRRFSTFFTRRKSDFFKNLFSSMRRRPARKLDDSNTSSRANEAQSKRRKSKDSVETTMPYEVANFLELALGEERLSGSSMNYDNIDLLGSGLDVSRFISNDTSNNAIPSSSTINDSWKERGGRSIVQEPEPMSNEHENQVREYLDEVKSQQGFINDARKELQLGTAKNDFALSPERVTYERILLTAQLRQTAYRNAINRLITKPKLTSSRDRGIVTIENIRVRLRENVQRRDYQSGNVFEWFILVISEGTTVWASEAIPGPIAGSTMYFPGKAVIPNLTPDFKISIQIYSMKTHDATGKQTTSTNDSWFSPKRLLRRSIKKSTSKRSDTMDIKGPSFILCGNLDIIWHDVNLKSPWPLSGVPKQSVLHGTIDLSISCKVKFTIIHTGYVTYCSDETGGLTSWNRCWCVLKDRKLLFWHYMEEQENRPPHYTIDLECCISRNVDLVDRKLSPRARTLLVKTMPKFQDENNVYVERQCCRHLLSCDTNGQLAEWQSKINQVVTTLREWYIIDV